MNQTTLKIKNDMVKIPRAWRGAQILIRKSEDTIVIKKVKPSTFWNTWETAASLGKSVSLKDITSAIKSVRKQSK